VVPDSTGLSALYRRVLFRIAVECDELQMSAIAVNYCLTTYCRRSRLLKAAPDKGEVTGSSPVRPISRRSACRSVYATCHLLVGRASAIGAEIFQKHRPRSRSLSEMERKGLEPSTSSLQSCEPLSQGVGKQGAYSGPIPTPSNSPSSCAPESLSDPRLDAIAEAWPTLPEAVRVGIVAMVEVSRGTTP